MKRIADKSLPGNIMHLVGYPHSGGEPWKELRKNEARGRRSRGDLLHGGFRLDRIEFAAATHSR